jgi:hypothetical protein
MPQRCRRSLEHLSYYQLNIALSESDSVSGPERYIVRRSMNISKLLHSQERGAGLTRKSLLRRSNVVRLPNLGRLSKLRMLSSKAAEWLSSTPGFCCWPATAVRAPAEASLTSNPNLPPALPGLAEPGSGVETGDDTTRAVTPPALDD